MLSVLRPILFFVFLISLGLNGYFLFQQREANIPAKILDGDTFQLPDGDRVRLLGVNAPETGRCGSAEATAELTKLISGKSVRIEEEKRDTYGRRMGLVYVGSTLVNKSMLAAGWARPDYTKNSKNEELKSAFHDASDNRRGLHSLCEIANPIPENPKCVIKGNIDQSSWVHLYHLPNCRHYGKIVLNLDLGEQFFCSEKEAQEAGFTLAPDCLR